MGSEKSQVYKFFYKIILNLFLKGPPTARCIKKFNFDLEVSKGVKSFKPLHKYSIIVFPHSLEGRFYRILSSYWLAHY